MIPSRRSLHLVIAAVIAALSVGCSGDPPAAPSPPPSLANGPPVAFVVSDPLEAAGAAGPTAAATTTAEVAYVSLPVGALPTAVSVTIRNLTSSGAATAPIPVVDGGFDPIPIAAKADDELELRAAGASSVIGVYRVVVPKRRPPGVVRTSPPRGAVDIPVNSIITVVFTEPILAATVTTTTVKLLQEDVPVRGTVRPVAGSVTAIEFVPEQDLAIGTTYRVVIAQAVHDVEGDALEADYTAEFTTLTSVATSAAVVAGWGHTCALGPDDAVLCWGENASGQLGAGNNFPGATGCPASEPNTFLPCSTLPVAVVGGHTFTALASGFEHTCALTPDGDVFCWGAYGNHGGEDWPPPCTSTRDCNCDPALETCDGVPRQVGGTVRFESIVSGYYHSCGLQRGGAAYCWGRELLPGELGTGDGGITATPAAVRGGIAFRSLASGAHHVCGLDFGGVAYCWGLNLAGQLGAAGGENCAGPATSNKDFVWSCVKAPTRVSGQLTFGSLTAGWQHTCGLTPAGRAYCWGDYLFAGTIGSVPRPVGADLVFTSLSSGSASSHTCGVTAANVAYCWGRNDKGQLGDGSTNSRLTPVRVDGGHAFAAVTAGDEHTCGITVAGVVYCWGNNVLGQLGVGIASAGSVRPVKVSGQ